VYENLLVYAKQETIKLVEKKYKIVEEDKEKFYSLFPKIILTLKLTVEPITVFQSGVHKLSLDDMRNLVRRNLDISKNVKFFELLPEKGDITKEPKKGNIYNFKIGPIIWCKIEILDIDLTSEDEFNKFEFCFYSTNPFHLPKVYFSLKFTDIDKNHSFIMLNYKIEEAIDAKVLDFLKWVLRVTYVHFLKQILYQKIKE